MNCEEAQHLFDAYLDDTLGGTLATEFGAHRVACNRCRRDLALLEVASHVIATDTETPLLGDEFTDRLVHCADKPKTNRILRLPRSILVGLPTAMAACIGLVVWFGGDSPSVVPTDREGPPRVLGVTETVQDPEELLHNVEEALAGDPNNVELQALAARLRERSQEIIDGTRDGASLLKDYGHDALKELLGSKPSGSKDGKTPAPQHDSPGKPAADAKASPPTEEL
ncbi:MAG: hypothetical protein GXP29_07500 [Planctomycetes bacterium]|nr:hypothetical protein [Planctomycetota bacterium]